MLSPDTPMSAPQAFYSNNNSTPPPPTPSRPPAMAASVKSGVTIVGLLPQE
jgi:hypothetical protein